MLRPLPAPAHGRHSQHRLAPWFLPISVTTALLAAVMLALIATPVGAQDSTPTVTITAPDAVVEGETVTVTLTRTQTKGDLDVKLRYRSGSGAQFSGTPPATARFEPGDAETTATFVIADNSRLLRIGEENWVLVGLDQGDGYTVGSAGQDSVHITVTDNDVPAVSIERAAGYSPSGWSKYPVVWAGDDAVFTLKRCDPATGECSGFVAPALTVNLLRRIVTGTNQVQVQDVSETATFDADAYSAEVRVPTAEAEEKGFQSEQIISVASGAGYNALPGSRETSLEVHAPYPQRVSIAAAVAQVNEGENVDFALTRCAHPNDEPVCFDRGLPALTVAVSVTDEGKVLSGEPPAQVTFAAGSATASLTLPTATDDLYEETLTVTATIAAPGAGNNAYELDAPGSAAVQVANTTPLPIIGATSAGASEEHGAIEFAVSLSPPSGVTAKVHYRIADGTATAGEDYTVVGGNLTFEPGETGKTVRVEIAADYETEDAETFTLVLLNPQHARFEGGEVIWFATGTIQAETAPTLSLTLTNQAPPGAAEPTIISGQPLQWRLVREGDASAELAVVLRYRVRAASVSGGVGEWTEGSIRQTFPAGQTSIDGSATVNAEDLGWEGEIHGEGGIRIATPEETSNEIGRRILYRIDPDASSGSFGIEHETPMVVIASYQEEVAAGDEAEFQLVRYGEFDNALTATVEFSGAFVGPARRDVVFPPETEIVRFKLWSRLPATDSDETSITASLAESTAYRTTTGGIEGDTNFRQSQIPVVDNGLPIVFIETDNDFAFEGSPVVFLLTRQAESYSTPLTVSVTVTDLRGSLVDEPPTEVRFATNSRRATLRLNTGSDSLVGMSDHVTATLNPGSGYRIPAPGDPSYEREASVTVRDNDVAGPTISYVSIVSDTGGDDVYDTNEPIWAHVTFNETAVVEGKPSLGLEFGDGDAETDAQAVYESGSGSSVLKFRYYPQPGDRAPSGITIPADSLQLNGGEIADRSDNAATLTHTAVSSSHRVNALPLATVTVDHISPPADAPSITVGDDDTTIRVRLRLTRTGDRSNELPVELYYGNTHIDFVDGNEYIDGRRAIRVINVFPVDDSTIEVEVTGEVTGYWGWLTDEGKVSAGGKLEFQTIPWMSVFRLGGYVSDADRYNPDPENSVVVHLRNQLPLVTIEPAWPEANEGDDAIFTLTRYGDGLAAPRNETLTVTVNVTGAGGVYNGPAQRTVTFEAGAETAELRIPTRAVESIGTMGTVTAALASSPTVYRLTDKVWDSGSRFDRATVDVAEVPLVSILATADQVDEGGRAVFTLSRASAGVSGVLIVAVTVRDLSGSLYLNETVTFRAGESTATLTAPIPDDRRYRPKERITATLSPGGGYRLASPGHASHPSEASMAVQENDRLTVSISRNQASATEGEDARFTVTRNGVSGDLRVHLRIGGHRKIMSEETRAIANRQTESGAQHSVLIEDGSETATLALTTEADDISEGNGELRARLVESPVPYRISGPGGAAVLVEDDDIRTVSLEWITPSDATLDESGTTWEATVTEGQPIGFRLVCSGSSGTTVDTQTLIGVFGDSRMNHPLEPQFNDKSSLAFLCQDGSFGALTIGNLPGVYQENPAGRGFGKGTSWEISRYVGPASGLQVFRVLSHEETQGGKTGGRYYLENTALFIGSCEDDFCPKYVLTGPTAARITVLNRNPTITITAQSGPVVEGGVASFTLRRLWNRENLTYLGTRVVLTITGDGASVAGSPTAVVTFAPGESEKTIEITSVDDEVREPEGSITVEIVKVPDVERQPIEGAYETYEFIEGVTPPGGNSKRATVTVTDNDGSTPVVTVEAVHDTVTEGEDVVLRLTRRGGDVSQALFFNISALVTRPDQSVTDLREKAFEPGEATLELTYPEVSQDDDAVNDLLEAPNTIAKFRATLSPGEGYEIGQPSSAEVRVFDNDVVSTGVALSVSPMVVAEDAGATAVTVTAKLNGLPRDEDTAVAVTVTAGSASAGDDFADVSGFTVTIPVGARSGDASFNLTPVDDHLVEGDETLDAAGSATGLTVRGTTLTITDNDEPPTAVTLSVNPATVGEGVGDTTVTVTVRPDSGTWPEPRTVIVLLRPSIGGRVLPTIRHRRAWSTS